MKQVGSSLGIEVDEPVHEKQSNQELDANRANDILDAVNCKIGRIKKVVYVSQACIFIIGAILGGIFLLLRKQLNGFFSNSPEVIEAGVKRFWVIMTTYYLCGMMDGMSNIIRGIGHSLAPVITSLCGACLYRIIWIFTIFQIPQFHTIYCIYITYPISWLFTFIANIILYIHYMKKIENPN